MERDEETGLEYHSARYYFPWLGRWLSADPIWIEDGVNVYMYCHLNPMTNIDISGNEGWEVHTNLDTDTTHVVRDRTFYVGNVWFHHGAWYDSESGTTSHMYQAYYQGDSGWTDLNDGQYEMALNAAKEIEAIFKNPVRKKEWDNSWKAYNTYNKIGQAIGITTGVILATPIAIKSGAFIYGSTTAMRLGHIFYNRMSLYLAGSISYGVITPAGAPELPGPGDNAGKMIRSTISESMDDVVRVERFLDVTQPSTFYSRASLASDKAAKAGADILSDPIKREIAAELHASGKIIDSPFVSVGIDASQLSKSTDPWLRTIATGKPGIEGVQRAPFIGVFEVPRNMLHTLNNELSKSEGQMLFFGLDLLKWNLCLWVLYYMRINADNQLTHIKR